MSEKFTDPDREATNNEGMGPEGTGPSEPLDEQNADNTSAYDADSPDEAPDYDG